MNEIYGGGVFDVSKAEARDPELTLQELILYQVSLYLMIKLTF